MLIRYPITQILAAADILIDINRGLHYDLYEVLHESFNVDATRPTTIVKQALINDVTATDPRAVWVDAHNERCEPDDSVAVMMYAPLTDLTNLSLVRSELESLPL